MIRIDTDGHGSVEIMACSDDGGGIAPEPHRMDPDEAERYGRALRDAADNARVERLRADP